MLCQAREGNKGAAIFLNNIIENKHKVFVDSAGKIIKEYETAKCTIVRQWLKTIGSKGLVKVKCKKTCKNFLNCTRDMKFVYVCLNNSAVRDIVSEDYHFVKGRALLLKRGIMQHPLEKALVLSRKNC